ncbi:hypothetical protein HK100_003483 [Physocladia obscura]|uniref:Vacuolar protein sorting-associated protein 54 C-terminal domain-containing protein n=1 Tax=Physocladia obscura TaxID=109957 RepID=A0AAD5XEJ8_9FUNG|nr:hypothetical protein HK100_003483 [Physocladia obscura]
MEENHAAAALRQIDAEHVWTAKDIGTNAIAGITTEPAKASLARALRGMDALAMVPPTQIPRVKPAEFEPYTKALEPVIDRYMSNKILGAAAVEGVPMLGSLEQQLESGSFADLVIATERILVDSSKPKYKTDRTTHRRLLAAHAPPLDTVPDLFFSKDFKLGNPSTFAEVYEKSDFSKLSLQDVNLTSNLLQDKLGVYCDTVDVYLVKEISKRSASFFNALSTLQALHLETQSCINQIHSLRNQMSELTANTIMPGLAVSRLNTRRNNVKRLHDGIEKIFKVQTNMGVLDAFIRQKQFGDAIELADELLLELKDLVDIPTVSSAKISSESDQKNDPIESYAASSTPASGNSGIKSITEKRQSLSISTNVNQPSSEKDPKESTENTPTEPQNEDLNLVQYLHKELLKKSFEIASQMDHEFSFILIEQIREVAANSLDEINPAIAGTATEVWIRNIEKRKKGLDIVKLQDHIRISSSNIASLNEDLTAQLAPIIFGLIRINRFGSTLQQYKDMLMKEIKVLTKKKYPVPPAEILEKSNTNSTSSFSPTTPSSPTSKKELQNILAKQLKQMSFDSFLDLLVSIYTTLLHIFQKASTIHHITATLISKAEDQGIHIGSSTSPLPSMEALGRKKSKKENDDDDDFGSGELFSIDPATDALIAEKKKETDQQRADATGFSQLISDSNDLLLAISEAANARCAKLLAVRSEQNSKLSPKDFYRLLGATKEFIAGSEFLCGYHCINLKGALSSQAKQFLDHFHDERTKQISIVVENEQWARAEIPIDFQHMAEEITASGALAVEQKKKSSERREKNDGVDDETDLAALVIAHKEAAVAASADELVTGGKVLKVDGQTFCVAGCILLLTKMLTEYLQCVDNMPTLATEAFNSRVCQVILGAGATRSAGLKAINAGHIGNKEKKIPIINGANIFSATALTAQSLGAVIGYIPHLKITIELHLPSKQHNMLSDFDMTLKDYQEHQVALYEKLVSIMQERLSTHSQGLLTINWDSPETKDMTPEKTCSVHIAALVKETTSMYRVLTKFLPKPSVKRIMGQIFKVYNDGLTEEFKNIDLFTSAGKNRLLIDGQYLIAELSMLENIDGLGNSVEVAINNIRIRDKSEKRSVANVGGGVGGITPVTLAPGNSAVPNTGNNTANSSSPSKTVTSAVTPQQPASTTKKNLFSKWKD